MDDHLQNQIYSWVCVFNTNDFNVNKGLKDHLRNNTPIESNIHKRLKGIKDLVKIGQSVFFWRAGKKNYYNEETSPSNYSNSIQPGIIGIGTVVALPDEDKDPDYFKVPTELHEIRFDPYDGMLGSGELDSIIVFVYYENG